MPETPELSNDWHHPLKVMKLHKLRKKKKALQARIKNESNSPPSSSRFEKLFSAEKRKNPFLKNSDCKRTKLKQSPVLEESEDQTLFKLLNCNNAPTEGNQKSFDNISFVNNEVCELVELVKAQGRSWIPIDWSLKYKMRLLSLKPFPWNQKLKISEEASALTAFTRCLDSNTGTTLDISPNAKFYQCCLYWQQPSLPWLTLFPRNTTNGQISSNTFSSVNSLMKESLQKAWSDSLRSLFQLIRTGQCPYFYACANHFTVLFRAAGICGFGDVHAIITPTTRGFRKLLKQEDIEFTMPLNKMNESDSNQETDAGINENEQDAVDDNWLKSLGVNDEEIKQFSYTQDRIQQKAESKTDNSEHSTVLIEGIEVQSLYNFLINCRSATTVTGPFADIPPTLLAPVSFHGSTINSLKVRQSKVHTDDADYYSLELLGPILPTTIHNLFEVSPPEHNMTITFNTTKSTEPFSKLITKERKSDVVSRGAVVFRKENLSDCGLLPSVLKHFCAPETNYVTNVECLKYISENETYTWT